MVFFENKENRRKISKGLLGERDSNAAPSQTPARRCKKAFRKAEAVSKKTVSA
jgi:hypothetical protein